MSEQDANKQPGNFDNADSFDNADTQETKQSGGREASNGSENTGRPTGIQQSYGAEGSSNQKVSSNSADELETSEGATDVQQSYDGGDKTSDHASQETNDS